MTPCPRCGAPLPDGAVAPRAEPPPGPEPPFGLWAALSVVPALLTCGAGLVFAVLGVVFASAGRSEWRRGRPDRARSRLRLAKAFALLGFGLFVALGAAAALLRLAGGEGTVPSY